MRENTKLIDLDCTLINSAARVDKEIATAERYGLTRFHYLTARTRVVARHGLAKFSYELQYLECREIMPGLSESVITDWYATASVPMLFDDTEPFLGSFPKEELVLLTAGHLKFQNIKINANNLGGRFAEIMIVESPKCNAVVNPPPGTVFIDDSPREIDAMKLLHPGIFCIQVREPAPWEDQRVSKHRDAYAFDLTEAIAIIKKNKDRLR